MVSMIGETILTIVLSIVGLIVVISIIRMFIQGILEKDLGEFLFSSLAIMFVVGFVLALLGV